MKQNSEPELAESFAINITGVELVGQVRGSSVGPRVRQPGNLASVTILEHGHARGVIQFNVTRVCDRLTCLLTCLILPYLHNILKNFSDLQTIHINKQIA